MDSVLNVLSEEYMKKVAKILHDNLTQDEIARMVICYDMDDYVTLFDMAVDDENEEE